MNGKRISGLSKDENALLDRLYGTYVLIADPEKFNRMLANPSFSRYTEGVKMPSTDEDLASIKESTTMLLARRNEIRQNGRKVPPPREVS